MSHFTRIRTEIRDLVALGDACRELGLELVENGEARGYGSNRIRGDAVVRLKGPYDVALQRGEGEGYRLVADLWNGHVEKELGTGCGRLLQLYGVHKTVREARRKGLAVTRRDLNGGRIRLTLSAP